MKPVSVYIDQLYKYDLRNEPCVLTVPFAKGELDAGGLKRLTVRDAARREVPCAFRATAEWPDGSVKYLFARLAVDLPANQNVRLELAEEPGAPDDSGEGGACRLTAVRGDGCITVDTGALCFSVRDGGSSVFQSVRSAAGTYTAEQFEGPVLKHGGTEAGITVERWRIEECSPVCCVLEGSGKYCGTYRVTVRITAYAGREHLDLAFRLFNDSEEELVPDSWNFYVRREAGRRVDDRLEEEPERGFDSTGCGDRNESLRAGDALMYRTTGTAELAEIEEEISSRSVSGIRTATGISNYRTTFQISGEGEALCRRITAQMLVDEASEHFAEVLYGTFFADVCDRNGGVCATVFQAQQNFPKAVKACADGLCVYLIPECGEKVHFASGMAREQRIQLHFHAAELPLEELDNRSLIYQMPPAAYVEPEIFGRAGVLPDIVTDRKLADVDVELALIARADQHGRAYGMMNWGDFPDENYTAQGRGGGRLVWSNNEYDYPHAMFMMYARSGERRFLDYAKVAALHWMDVDVCHYSADPLKIGGQWEHTACHNGGSFPVTGVRGVMVCSHEWVEGLLDLWHFTGDRRAYDTAEGIGENVLRLLDTPMYQKPGEANARETGWALRTLLALYNETNDEKWIAKSRWIVGQFREWKERYGAWLAPYTDNTVIRVGFMISVAVGSLMRYYRVFPEEEVKELILAAVDDLVENARNPFGLFYYKDLPSLRRNGNNTLLLESMYIGYELTGNADYLRAGLLTFRANMGTAARYEGVKSVREDAVLVGRTSPKGFAQSFLPLVQFYNAAAAEGLLDRQVK